MTWFMVDVESDGPCPGLYSMVSLGAVVVEPICKLCGDTGRAWDNGDKTDCGCVNRTRDKHGTPARPEEDPRRTFYARFRPLDGASWQPEALAVSGHSREECLSFPDPAEEMSRFDVWIRENSSTRFFRGQETPNAMFVSDNNGFDWQFVNYYFWRFCGHNPFGHSSTNLGSLYKGLVKDVFKNFKHLRRTKHTHHPVDDAKGNAEAMVALKPLGLTIGW